MWDRATLESFLRSPTPGIRRTSSNTNSPGDLGPIASPLWPQSPHLPNGRLDTAVALGRAGLLSQTCQGVSGSLRGVAQRRSFASRGLFSHGRPYPCMGSRAGSRPGPRSRRAARGAAEGETEEPHAAPWAAVPTRRRPCRLQSPGAQQRGGAEEGRGARARSRPVPGGPRAPPARRPGRSSWRAGGTIESPRHRPLTARARLPQCTAQWPDRRHYRGLSGPAGARARPGPRRGAPSAVSAGEGVGGRWGAGREAARCARAPGTRRGGAPQRGRPYPRPGGPSASARAQIGPGVMRTLPGPSTGTGGPEEASLAPLPFKTWRHIPEGPPAATPRLPGDPENTLLTLSGTRVWGTQISCTCSLPSDTPTLTHIIPFPALNSPLFYLLFHFSEPHNPF